MVHFPKSNLKGMAWITRNALMLMLLLISHLGLAQAPTFQSRVKDYNELEVLMDYAPKSGWKVGDVVTFQFKARILDHAWHAYSCRQDGKIAYQPTEMFLFADECKGVKLSGKMTENLKPHEREDKIMEGLIRDFKEHEVTFTQKVKITGKEVVLSGEFSIQYCTMGDMGQCKVFKSPLEWRFTALDGVLPAEEGATPITMDAAPVDSAQTDSTSKAPGDTTKLEGFLPFGPGNQEAAVTEKTDDCSTGALFNMFLLAFVAGLGAILTPCVFPMIPMTVSFFLKQGEGEAERAAGIRNGAIYALSIVGIYAIFGLLVSMVFGESALHILGSHWIPNLIFFLIFLVFAMSFFGMFEIVLPSSWSTAMNNKAGQGGILGPFFMALTLVIVSFSCTGPILGAAVVGSTQGAVCTWKPFMAFLGFGIAFAVPFGLLAMFPKLMEKLPMAGGWMNTVKVVFGFLELALCMKFLSNVDLALGLHLLDRQVFLAVWIVVFSLLGAYFMGWVTLPHDEKLERTSVPRLLMAVASFSFTMYLFPGLWGAPLSSLEGLVPPMNINVGVRLQPHQLSEGKALNQKICEADRKLADKMSDREAHGFCMFYDLEQALAFARAENRPLFVDFTGHTCANCRKMENDVWPNEQVHKMLTEEFVMVSLYADEDAPLDKPLQTPEGTKLRRVSDYVRYYQSRNFGVVSQPYYVIMDLDQRPLNTPVGYTPDVQDYIAFLKEGLEKFKALHGTEAP